jgi:hypothetical protein
VGKVKGSEYYLKALYDLWSLMAPETMACGKVPVLHGSASEKGDVPLDPRSRIVGGTECPKGHCPWQVQYEPVAADKLMYLT